MKLSLPYEIICQINKFIGSPTAPLIPPYRPSRINWEKYDRILYKYRIYRMLCEDRPTPFYVFTEVFMETILDMNIYNLRYTLRYNLRSLNADEMQ